MREIPRDGDNHAFLLKALHEASGELENALYGVSRRDLRRRQNDDWSLIEIAGHLRDKEEQTLSYLRAITASKRPELPAVDLAMLVAEGGYEQLDPREVLYQFADLRQETLYLLYRLSAEKWQRAGVHEYRGRLTVAQLVKELNEHDLRHLWQIQRIKECLP